MTLIDLNLGEAGAVVKVDGAREFRRRLMELGIVPGVRVVLKNVSPLGDPLDIEVRSARLSIRRNEARLIEVQR